MAEHASHIEFENELYATLVDPVAEGSIKEADMRKQLLESARWYRQHVHDLETQLNARPTTQASSEIRETLTDVVQFFDSNYESSGDWCNGPSAKYFDGLLAKLRALAPSRQGAGGK